MTPIPERLTAALADRYRIERGAWGKLGEARRLFAEAEARGTVEYMQPRMMAFAASAAGELEKVIVYADRADARTGGRVP